MTAKEATAVTTTEPEVSSLVALAINKGVDVEVLERLVALQERVTERNARAAFFEALANFQEETPAIHKSKTAEILSKRTGHKFSYSYAPLEEIAKAIRPTLRKHGLSYRWDTDGVANGVMMVVCVLRHVEGHEDRSTFPVPVDGGDRMSAAQANGGALTYGKRQSLIAVLGLTTTDDDNDGSGDAASGGGKPGDKITEGQAADLQVLLLEVGADKAKFLKWLKVGSLADIPVEKYREAVAALEQKRRAT